MRDVIHKEIKAGLREYIEGTKNERKKWVLTHIG